MGAVAGTDADSSLYYAGAAGGGVWKTTNAGQSWLPVFDKQDVQSIGAIAIDPSNVNVLWVGTGEGAPRNDVIQGDGVYRSGDGGKTWQRVLALNDALDLQPWLGGRINQPQPLQPYPDPIRRASEQQCQVFHCITGGEEAAQLFIIGVAPRLSRVRVRFAQFCVRAGFLFGDALQFGEHVLETAAQAIDLYKSLVNVHVHTLSRDQ